MTHDLSLPVISPFADDYKLFNPAKCIGYSAEEGGRILIKLGDSKELELELRTYLQTEKYIARKNDAAAPETLKKILRERGDENRLRRARLVTNVEGLVGQGSYYAVGQPLSPQSTVARVAVGEAQDYLIKNLYTKLEYLKELHDDPQREIRATLTSDDIGQYNLQLNVEAGNVAGPQRDQRLHRSKRHKESPHSLLANLLNVSRGGRMAGPNGKSFCSWRDW